MDVIASFKYSTEVELVVQKLEEKGIEKSNIIAIPLDEKMEENTNLFDSMYHADGVSLLDLGLIFGCIFMLLGAIYGFVLTWGPVIWGLIGLIVGTSCGVLIKIWYIKRKSKQKLRKGGNTDVFLTIRCSEKQSEMVKKILFNHYALGVGIIE